MPGPDFRPGFRISLVDGGVLVLGVAAMCWIGPSVPQYAFVIGFVIGHFFIFCNVFRVARSLELAWSAALVALCFGKTQFGWPSWSVTIGGSLLATIVVIAITLRKPSYHGIGWRLINPRLPEWWAKSSIRS